MGSRAELVSLIEAVEYGRFVGGYILGKTGLICFFQELVKVSGKIAVAMLRKDVLAETLKPGDMRSEVVESFWGELGGVVGMGTVNLCEMVEPELPGFCPEDLGKAGKEESWRDRAVTFG